MKITLKINRELCKQHGYQDATELCLVNPNTAEQSVQFLRGGPEYSPLPFHIKHQILFGYKMFGNFLRIFPLQAQFVPSYQTKLKLGSYWVALSWDKRGIPMVGTTNICNISWLQNSSLLSELLKFSLSCSWGPGNTFELNACNTTQDLAFKGQQKKLQAPDKALNQINITQA